MSPLTSVRLCHYIYVWFRTQIANEFFMRIEVALCGCVAVSIEKPSWGIEHHSTRGQTLHLVRELLEQQAYKNRNPICDKFRHIQGERERDRHKKTGTERGQWNCTLLCLPYSTFMFSDRLVSRINAVFFGNLPAVCACCRLKYKSALSELV